jgi:uroporphyrinogen decarboxylase-like protein
MKPAVEVIFNPNWWFRNYGISFAESFYFDREQRIENDLKMRKVLHERFGIGESNPEPRPIIGSRHVAGGFVIPALLGVEVRFSDNQAPWNVPANLDRSEILRLQAPDVEAMWPTDRLIKDMEWLEKEFGYVVGDFNTGGLINTGLELRGQQLFIDMLEDQELVSHLFRVIGETQIRVARCVEQRTGTNSISVNRSIVNVDSKIYVHSNCSVQMISPKLYESTLLPHERRLAEQLPPFGIHHCGNNLQLFADAYAELEPVFCDVGWGSEVERVSVALPGTFLNLRLDPVRMLQRSRDEIRADAESLLDAAGPSAGLCCINMDYGTPDENVMAMFECAATF